MYCSSPKNGKPSTSRLCQHHPVVTLVPNAHRVLSPLSFPQVACTNVGNPIWATEVIISSSGCLRTLCLAHNYVGIPCQLQELEAPSDSCV